MMKAALIGALASLLLALPARADWRTPIHGALPALPATFIPTDRAARRVHPFAAMPGATTILPSRFIPMGYDVVAPLEPDPAPAAGPVTSNDVAPTLTAPAQWSLPLFDRRLSQAEREADIAPELQDVIMRAEPLYDPTRVDGPDAEVALSVSSGTAAMDNVFADHWSLASPDANVNVRARYIAMAWQRSTPLPCQAFAKRRPHGFGDPALTALGREDCATLRRYQALRFDAAPEIAIAVAAVPLPVFAAPLPGSRMSSGDFWAAQKARIAAIQAHLHDKWQGGRVSELPSRP